MKKKDNNVRDLIIKIVLIIIIIILLIHNCTLMKKNNQKPVKTPSGNVDIIEITCDNDQCETTDKDNDKNNSNNPNTISSLSFSQNKYSVKTGKTLSLNVIVKPSSLANSKLTWSSSDENIAIVDANGVVKAIKEGTVTITVTSSNGKVAKCTINVTNDDIELQKINLNTNEMTLKVGDSNQIIATISPENATFGNLTWTSSDESIAKVDANGVVKAIKEGTVTITVTSSNGKKNTCKVIVKPNTIDVEKIEVNPTNINIENGSTVKISVNILPSNATDKTITWSSSDENIATVDANGVITAIKEGVVIITATSSNGKNSTCKVTVIPKVINAEDIVLDHDELTIKVDDTAKLKAKVLPDDTTDKNVLWSSSDENIATVNANGEIVGLKVGNVTITAKTIDGKVSKSCNVKVEMNYIEDALNVYDQDKTPVKWNGATDLKIFEKSYYTLPGVIAPESEDIYQFEVKNKTAYKLNYQIKFIETNNYDINMKYKLKKNDTYLIDRYVSANELNVSDMLLNVNEEDTYYLEWKWISSSNDTEIGKNPSANYGLKIEITAESID